MSRIPSARAAARPLARLGLVALTLLPGAALLAQTTYTWNGNGGAANWSNAANWTGGVAPASDINNTLLVLDGALQLANTLDYSFSANSLGYASTASSFTTTGTGTLTLGSGGLTDNAGVAESFSAPITLGAAQTWTNNGVGVLTVGGTITNGGFGLTTTGTGSTTLAGAFNGAGGLTTSGTGTLTLSGASTYTGATAVNAGTLTYSGTASSSGNGSINVAASSGVATLNINTSGTLAFNNGGAVNVGAGTGSGVVNQSAGTVNLNAGTNYLSIGFNNAGAYGDYNLTGGTLNVQNSSGIRLGGGGVGVFTESGGTLTLSRYLAVAANTGGGGTGVATFTGGTATTATGYSILVGDTTSGVALLNLGTEAGGSAKIVSQASAGLEITDGNAGAAAVSTVNLNSGTLEFTASGIVKGGTSGTSTLNLNGATIQAGANNLTLIASGLSAVNVDNGGVTFDTQTNNATVAASLLKPAGSGIYHSGGTISISSGGGTGYAGTPAVTVTGGSGTGATAIADMVNGVITGVTLTSPGQNYAANDVLSFAFSGGGDTTAATTFQYTLAAADLAANSTGGLTKIGTGTLTLTGANTYAGATNVNAGTLAYSGAASNSGSGNLSVAASASQNASVTFGSTGTTSFSSGAGITVGGAAGASGAVTQSSGTVNLSPGANYLLLGGNSTTAYGSYTLSGGTLNINNSSGMRLGLSGTGVFTQTGGTLNISRYLAIAANTGTGGTGVATFLGGTANGSANYSILVGDTANGVAYLNIGSEAGGTATVVSQASAGLQVVDGSGANDTGSVNLNSGTLELTNGSILKSGTSGTATLNLNGGTIQAGAAGLTLVNGTLNAVNVYNGGVTIDTQTNNATVSANLLGTSGSGIYESGGTLTVGSNGGAGYIGAPAATVTGGSGSGASAIADVTNGVITGVTLTNPGQNYQVGDTLTFTFTGGGDTTAASAFQYTLTAADLAANGAGGLTKIGTGTLTLTGANTYTGLTAVNAGTLQITGAGSIAQSTNIQLASGATLDGSGVTSGASFNNGSFSLAAGQTLSGLGSVTGALDARSGSTIAPGFSGSTGILTINGNTTLESGSNFAVTIAGNTAGTTYDQLDVNGTVSLTGSKLLLTSTYAPTSSDDFFLIDNDGTDPITGAFNGLANGSAVSFLEGGITYTGLISYTGDSASNAVTGGNDVVLYDFTTGTSTSTTPEPAALALLAGAAGPLGWALRRRAK